MLTDCRKDENKEKEAENGPFKKTSISVLYKFCGFYHNDIAQIDSTIQKRFTH